MIALTDNFPTSWPINFGIGRRSKRCLSIKYIKKVFIEYWKRIIKVIHHYKNKCRTFYGVIIRPIIHIRTLHKVYDNAPADRAANMV